VGLCLVQPAALISSRHMAELTKKKQISTWSKIVGWGAGKYSS